MAKLRGGLLALALVGTIGLGWVRTHRAEPTPRFCTAEGLVWPESGHQFHKDEDCRWVDEDGNLLVDEKGQPVDASTPPEDLLWSE